MAFNPNEHMIPLKGKDYLQVAWRLVWFRDEHPDWSISAEMLEHDEDHAIFRAVICDENGCPKSTGHGSESKRDFGDFLEKAETKAVGRALAMLGYGTQFAADELDEGERIVDSPIDRKPRGERAEATEMASQAQIEVLRMKLTSEQWQAMEGKYGANLANLTKEAAGKALAKIKAMEK